MPPPGWTLGPDGQWYPPGGAGTGSMTPATPGDGTPVGLAPGSGPLALGSQIYQAQQPALQPFFQALANAVGAQQTVPGSSKGEVQPSGTRDPNAAPTGPATWPGGGQAPKNLYGFDPLSLGQIFSQTFAPYIQANSQQLQGDIANYGKMMQQALQGASPQYRQAYAVSAPAMQQAMSMENLASKNFVAEAPAIDALIQGLTNATNAAKAAGQYASIAPYYSSLISGAGGLFGAGGATGAAQPAMTTPFTYGTPGVSTPAASSLLAQQNLANLANLAAQGK